MTVFVKGHRISSGEARTVSRTKIMRAASGVGARIVETVRHRPSKMIMLDNEILEVGLVIDGNLDKVDVLEMEGRADEQLEKISNVVVMRIKGSRDIRERDV